MKINKISVICVAAFALALISAIFTAYRLLSISSFKPEATGYCVVVPQDKVAMCNLELMLDKEINVKGLRIWLGNTTLTVNPKLINGNRIASSFALQALTNTTYNLFIGIEAVMDNTIQSYRSTLQFNSNDLRYFWKTLPKPVRKTYTLNSTTQNININVQKLLGQPGYAMIASTGIGELHIEAHTTTGKLAASRTIQLTPNQAPMETLSTGTLKEKPQPLTKINIQYNGTGTATVNIGLYNAGHIKVDIITNNNKYIPIYLPILAYPVAFK